MRILGVLLCCCSLSLCLANYGALSHRYAELPATKFPPNWLEQIEDFLPEISMNLYHCSRSRHCHDGNCAFRQGECEARFWMFTATCQHCDLGYFGAECNAYSPQCVGKYQGEVCERYCPENTFLQWILSPNRNTSCVVKCVDSVCVEKFYQPICKEDCTQCLDHPRVGCMEGKCFKIEGAPRTCAYGYGAKAKVGWKGSKVMMYDCVKCVDALTFCGNEAITCSDLEYTKCSCEKSDYPGGAVPPRCRSCQVDRWGTRCEHYCLCSEDANCNEFSGECVCKPDKPHCERCFPGKSGPDCSLGCLARCNTDPKISCYDEYCAVTDLSVKKVCPYGYGSYSGVKLAVVNDENLYLYNCTRCFNEMEMVPTCGVTEGRGMCSDSNYTLCSCRKEDYKNFQVPQGCKHCNETRWGVQCEKECLCAPDAICNEADGSCECPRNATTGELLPCQRCPFMRNGTRCDEKCTGHCNDDYRVGCKENRCIAREPSARPCKFGFGSVSDRRTTFSPDGTVCRRCFDVDYDYQRNQKSTREICGSDEVTCSSYNYSRCSCESTDYQFGTLPNRCRRCEYGMYGPGCEKMCSCHEMAECDSETGACDCSRHPACSSNPCAPGYRLKKVVNKGKTYELCLLLTDAEKPILLFVTYEHYMDVYQYLIFGIPGLFAAIALLGCLLDLIRTRKRICLIFQNEVLAAAAENYADADERLYKNYSL